MVMVDVNMEIDGKSASGFVGSGSFCWCVLWVVLWIGYHFCWWLPLPWSEGGVYHRWPGLRMYWGFSSRPPSDLLQI